MKIKIAFMGAKAHIIDLPWVPVIGEAIEYNGVGYRLKGRVTSHVYHIDDEHVGDHSVTVYCQQFP